MTDLLSEITFCDECPYSGEPNGCNRKEGVCKAHESYFDLVEENTTLRERLKKAVELQFEVGSTIYSIHKTDEEDNFNPGIDKGVVETVSLSPELWIYIRFDSGLTMWYTKDTFDKEVCLTLEAAEARLAELKGMKK